MKASFPQFYAEFLSPIFTFALPGLLALGPWAVWGLRHIVWFGILAEFDPLYAFIVTAIAATVLGISFEWIGRSIEQRIFLRVCEAHPELSPGKDWYPTWLSYPAQPAASPALRSLFLVLECELAFLCSAPIALAGVWVITLPVNQKAGAILALAVFGLGMLWLVYACVLRAARLSAAIEAA